MTRMSAPVISKDVSKHYSFIGDLALLSWTSSTGGKAGKRETKQIGGKAAWPQQHNLVLPQGESHHMSQLYLLSGMLLAAREYECGKAVCTLMPRVQRTPCGMMLTSGTPTTRYVWYTTTPVPAGMATEPTPAASLSQYQLLPYLSRWRYQSMRPLPGWQEGPQHWLSGSSRHAYTCLQGGAAPA